jgi:diguanylate cyclase (GGDEF)-like protein
MMFRRMTGIWCSAVLVLTGASALPVVCSAQPHSVAFTAVQALPQEAVPGTARTDSALSIVTFGQQPVANDSEIPWSESTLVIRLSAPRDRNPAPSQFRYRLLGVDTDWVETTDPTVRYARLAPGAYRFQAARVDSGQSRSSELKTGSPGEPASPVAEISFVITPRWWQSGPLRLGLVLVAALGVVLLWRGSVRLLVAQKQGLTEAVKLRTEDLEREKAELLRAREQMRHYAEHDDLTGLWNHRIIVERLRQEVDRSSREGSPISVIVVDLDHFKMVNDTFGHMAGDLVLKEVGAIFQRSVRSYDWVGRYGGEEFLLILPGSGIAGARIRAEQLRIAVQWADIHDGERAIPITASFGVACGIPSGYESLIKAADAALYRAKGKGRNCVVATEVDSTEHPKLANG